MKKTKKIFAFILSLFTALSLSFCAFAYEIPSFSESGKIMGIAHGGDCSQYPENSLSAVTAAFKSGADFVSLPAVKTLDGMFFVSSYDNLGETCAAYSGIVISQMTGADFASKSVSLTDISGNISTEKLGALSEALQIAKAYKKAIIIDTPWENRNELYSYLVENDVVDSAVFRTDASKREISQFLEITNGSLSVLGVYNGNIIMSAKSYVSSLIKNGCGAVQLGTKNPFGVIFNKSMLSSFSPGGYSTRAVISACDPYVCGQRSDSTDGWNDFVDRGYSVIETRDISALNEYIEKTETLRAQLTSLVNTANTLNLSAFSEKSIKDIDKVKKEAVSSLQTLSSLGKLEKVKSELVYALQNKNAETGESSSKGILNITVGKIAAVIIIGAALIAFQVYIFKKRDIKNKKTN